MGQILNLAPSSLGEDQGVQPEDILQNPSALAGTEAATPAVLSAIHWATLLGSVVRAVTSSLRVNSTCQLGDGLL